MACGDQYLVPKTAKIMCNVVSAGMNLISIPVGTLSFSVVVLLLFYPQYAKINVSIYFSIYFDNNNKQKNTAAAAGSRSSSNKRKQHYTTQRAVVKYNTAHHRVEAHTPAGEPRKPLITVCLLIVDKHMHLPSEHRFSFTKEINSQSAAPRATAGNDHPDGDTYYYYWSLPIFILTVVLTVVLAPNPR